MTADGALREAGVLDLPLIAALHQACFIDSPEAGEVWDKPAISEILAIPGVRCLLASCGDQPAGLVIGRIASDEMEILSLGVVPSLRRRGIAHRLLTASFDRAASAGAIKIFLEVAEDNGPARGTYESAGFQVVGRRPAYYRRAKGAAAAALILSRDCG